MKTMKQLTSYTVKKEGKKSQVKIGDVKEMLGILSDILYDDFSVSVILYKNGFNRSKRKKK